MKSIRCILGFHKWRYIKLGHPKIPITPFVKTQRCERCGKKR
jgi:hypothetical protein